MLEVYLIFEGMDQQEVCPRIYTGLVSSRELAELVRMHTDHRPKGCVRVIVDIALPVCFGRLNVAQAINA